MIVLETTNKDGKFSLRFPTLKCVYEERRVMKAHYFQKSMISKGQPEADALRIASNYYHVPEESVKNFSFPESPDPLDDDVWFMLGGHTPIAASEMLNEGDFF